MSPRTREVLPGWIALLVVAALARSAGGAIPFVLMRPVEMGLEQGLYSPRVAASVTFALAGVYQLTPLREVCLAKCRSPMTVLSVATAGPAAFRDLRAGALHGAWCLACCWALMAVLALVGQMNVAAMVLLALFIFVEKTTRYGVPAGRVAGLAMLAASVTVAVGALSN